MLTPVFSAFGESLGLPSRSNREEHLLFSDIVKFVAILYLCFTCHYSLDMSHSGSIDQIEFNCIPNIYLTVILVY